MAIAIKKTPAFVPGQGLTMSGTGPGMTVRTPGGGGPILRPLVDANHLHVWNCDESPGATELVDCVGGKNLTLHGTPGIDYTLGTNILGATPWLRILQDGSSTVPADNFTLNVNSNAYTLECVVYFTENVQPYYSERNFMVLSGATQAAYISCHRNNYRNVHSHVWNQGNETGTAQSVDTLDNVATHFMFSYSSSTFTLFENGVARYATASPPYAAPITMTAMQLCGALWLASTPKCYIRDVRVSNITRDATYAAAAAAALTT